MNKITKPDFSNIRADFVPSEHFLSSEFLRLENERLWPRVWQVACREEEVATPGAFVTYNILDESIVVLRTNEMKIKAFYNVCQHRGRRLTEGCGKMSRFHCGYHGWQYDLDGKVTRILDREEWNGCPNFTDKDLSLKEVKVDTWGGFVFVNMDPNCESLRDFLAPMPHYIDPFEMEKMSYRWYCSIKVPCNWKIAINAFNEAYHVSATHPQVMHLYGEDRNANKIFGKHAMFYYPGNPAYPVGAPSPRLGMPVPQDLRASLVEYYKVMNDTLRAVFCDRDVEAASRILTEVDASTPYPQVMMKVLEFQKEAAIAAGVGWPNINIQQLMEAGTDWHVFPNLIFLPYPSGALAYRALPDAKDPDVCTFEIYGLQRYAPGQAPELNRMFLHGEGQWREFKKINTFLSQDMENVARIQAGMKSRGFAGGRTNPVQELTVSNFHKVIYEYMFGTPVDFQMPQKA
jgi:phenylpropionate dioxygenase-like ring-hydroxylating dioxygenase large terminal subunit